MNKVEIASDLGQNAKSAFGLFRKPKIATVSTAPMASEARFEDGNDHSIGLINFGLFTLILNLLQTGSV